MFNPFLIGNQILARIWTQTHGVLCQMNIFPHYIKQINYSTDLFLNGQ